MENLSYVIQTEAFPFNEYSQGNTGSDRFGFYEVLRRGNWCEGCDRVALLSVGFGARGRRAWNSRGRGI